MDSTIEKAIKDEYDSKERYDIMDHLDEMKDVKTDDTSSDTSNNDTSSDTTTKKSTSSSKLSVSDFWVIVVILIILDIIYTELRIKNVKKTYDEKIDKLEKKIPKEVKKPKKVSK